MVLKNLFAGQQWRNRHREQTFGHGQRRGEVEIYGESNMEANMLLFIHDSFNVLNLLYFKIFNLYSHSMR